MKAHFSVDANTISFDDLIDIDAFSIILKNFAEATNIANGIVLPDGTLVASFGWQTACEKFHRGHPITNDQCISSNLDIMQQAHDQNGVSCRLCKNGIIDYATPIQVENKTIATLFLGQLFHETPDLNFFRQQAVKFDFDETQYIEAINAIPIMPESQVKALMKCIVNMAEMLANTSLANMRRVTAEYHLSINQQRTIQLEHLLNQSPVAIGWSHSETGKIEYVNQAFIDLFGYDLSDLPDIKTWDKLAYPDPIHRRDVILPWRQKVANCRRTDQQLPKLETDVHTKSGEIKHVLINVSWVEDKRLINFTDMSEHWLTERRIKAHDHMLEMVAVGTPLAEILSEIVTQTESEDPTCLCSVLLTDKSGKHLINGAAPNLPDFYNQAIDGIEIGDKVGSCGTAAYRADRVVVEDVMTHEYWQPFTELAKKANIRSCWSEPIISSTGKALGTFAIYHSIVSKPTQTDLERIKFAANIAAVAIESDTTHKELEFRAYYDFLTNLKNRRHFFEITDKEIKRALRYEKDLSLLMLDIDYFKVINDTYGHEIGDKVLQHFAYIIQSSLRDIDSIGRIGGEEFAILLPETSLARALDLAERVRKNVEGQPFQPADQATVKYTVSIGICQLSEQNSKIETLFHHADEALYQAKNAGRNCIRTFNND